MKHPAFTAHSLFLTQNELVDPDGTRPEHGMLEYVGPNMNIKDLPEVEHSR